MKRVPRNREFGCNAAQVVAVIDGYSVLGFEAQAVGFNFRAACFAGIPIDRVLVCVAVILGGIAGVGGSLEVIGLTGRDPGPDTWRGRTGE